VKRDGERGFAMLVVLVILALLTAVLAGAIYYSRQDRVNASKSVHNLTVQEVTESTLQYARTFFAQNYAAWNTYLAYFVTARTLANVTTDHPELLPPLAAGTNYDCYIYARDDADELPPATNNPSVDNNLRIFVGAVCSSKAGVTPAVRSELIAPLEYNPASQSCQSQFSGGTQGVNNCTTVAGYR
jgi:type II secretory pathway pseudopilin PulG